ncbi:hypothetical protein BH23PLA1_BH23PLA1_34950 [soil metagenome]
MRYPGIFLLALLVATVAGADDFERLEGRTLSDLPGSDKAKALERLTIADLAALPNLLDASGAVALIVETNEGNPSKLLLAPAFRQAPGADPDEEPAPIFVLERFTTFEGPSARDRIAQGRGILLFDGFGFDLDSGQVVPQGQGADILFRVDGDEGPRLEPVGGARLFALTDTPEFEGPGPGQPSPGRNVLPEDFAGRYRLFADGSLSGTLTLEVVGRNLSGRFRSEQSGTLYRVAGEVAIGSPRRLRFTIELPRTRQLYEGDLFAEGKGAIAGTMLMQESQVGFFALREGGPFVLDEGLDRPLPTPRPGDEPTEKVLRMEADESYSLDQQSFETLQDVVEALKAAVKVEPGVTLLLEVPEDRPHREVLRIIEAIEAVGVSNIGLRAVSVPEPENEPEPEPEPEPNSETGEKPP